MGRGSDATALKGNLNVSGSYIPGQDSPPINPYVTSKNPKINYAPTITSDFEYVYYDEFFGPLYKKGNKLLNTSDKDKVIGFGDIAVIKDPPDNIKMPPLTGDIVPPNTKEFYPGDVISLYGEFVPIESGCDLIALTFNWKIELFHSTGRYEYMSATTSGIDRYPTNCVSSSQWEAISPSNLPDYQWDRNSEGNIIGSVTLETIDINGYPNKSEEYFVSVKYKPNTPILEIVDQGPNTITLHMRSEGADEFQVNTYSSTHQGTSPFVTDQEVYTLSDWKLADAVWVTSENQYGTSEQSLRIYNRPYAKLPYSCTFYWDFDNWNTYNNGIRSRVNMDETGYDDLGRLEMEANVNGSLRQNIADLYLDLHNEENVGLSFMMKDFGDENHDKDAIYLSVDGGCSFTQIYQFYPESYPDDWNQYTIDLSQKAQDLGLQLSKRTIVRFSHKDDYKFPTDGFMIDKVEVTSNYTPPSPVMSMSLSAAKDAPLLLNKNPAYDHYENTNFGDNILMRAAEWTHGGYKTNFRNVLGFDLSAYPESLVLKSAKLSLYSPDPQPTDDYKHMSYLSTNNSGHKSNACWLRRIVEDWDENTVTYNTAPSTTDYHAEYLPISENYSQDYTDIDVTHLVNDMLMYPNTSYGFHMQLVDEEKYTRMTFASSDHPDPSLHPKLELEYYIDETVYNIPFTEQGSTVSETNDWNVQGGDGNDKAYLVYVPKSMDIKASTCSPLAGYDTKIEIFRADKTSSAGYNDDSEAYCSANQLASEINTTLSPGYYYFVVDGYNGETGNFELTVESEEMKSIPFTVNGSTVSETDDWNVQGGDGNDKAYLVYVPSSITIDAWTDSPDTDYDTKLEIFNFDGSTTGYYNDDTEDPNYSGLASGLFNKTLSAGYYYFVVDGYNGATGNFELTVEISSGNKNAGYPSISEAGEMEIKVFPNPVNDQLNVLTLGVDSRVNIIDLNGRVVRSSEIKKDRHIIDCSDIVQGIYIIQIIAGDLVETRKFEKL